MADGIELMEATLDRVVELINNKDVVWHCRAATDLNKSGRCKDAVEYTLNHDGCMLVLLSGTDNDHGIFREGAVTLTVDNSPVVLRLPPELADQAVKAAIKGIMARSVNN